MPEVLLLDAMGVLYQAGDDVAELLVPFVNEHGRTGLASHIIERHYIAASLGEMPAAQFWEQGGVDPMLEDKYLAGHRLIDSTEGALPALKRRFGRLACLSNDVGIWSTKLRRRFRLETWIDAWFISGDMGLRKPAPEIHLETVTRLGVRPDEITFVDDRPRNLDAAQGMGIRTVLVDPRSQTASSSHTRIRSLTELL